MTTANPDEFVALLHGPTDPSKGAYVDWARKCALSTPPEMLGPIAKFVVGVLHGYTFLPPTPETIGLADQAEQSLNLLGTLEEIVEDVAGLAPFAPLDTLRDKPNG